MPAFTVYQQRSPTPNPREPGDNVGNIAEVGTVTAYSPEDAIQQASRWPAFRGARQLGRFPVVREAG